MFSLSLSLKNKAWCSKFIAAILLPPPLLHTLKKHYITVIYADVAVVLVHVLGQKSPKDICPDVLKECTTWFTWRLFRWKCFEMLNYWISIFHLQFEKKKLRKMWASVMAMGLKGRSDMMRYKLQLKNAIFFKGVNQWQLPATQVLRIFTKVCVRKMKFCRVISERVLLGGLESWVGPNFLLLQRRLKHALSSFVYRTVMVNIVCHMEQM